MTHDRLLSIGELSRASGLAVSALRYYDRAGVLAPTCVDGWSGYRRYAPSQVREARLLAGMRRVQVPVAEMASVLEGLRSGDVEAVQDLLDGHLTRLEQGLADARRELALLRASLDGQPEDGPRAPRRGGAQPARLPARTLLALLGAVRHAVGTDPDLPLLMGVLVEVGDRLTLVSTDRYRMVVAGPWQREDPGAEGCDSVVVPTAEVDRLAVWLDGRDADVDVAVDHGALLVREAGRTDGAGTDGTGTDEVRLDVVEGAYPDYRLVLEHGGGQPVGAAVLEEALRGEDRLVDLAGLTVDRSFLQDAVRSVPDGQVLLPGEGVIAPLVVRSPDEDLLALVMPVLGQDA